MKIAVMAVLLVAMVGLACSGGAGIRGLSEEEQLRRDAIEYTAYFLEGDAVSAYPHTASDYRHRCSFEDFAVMMLLVRGVLGDVKDAKPVVDKAWIEGSRGLVEERLEKDGVTLIEFTQDDEGYAKYWVKEDGKWKFNDEHPEPCRLD